jgi:hypothetical protein
VLTFQRNLLPPLSEWVTEGIFETSVRKYQITRHNVPGDSKFYTDANLEVTLNFLITFHSKLLLVSSGSSSPLCFMQMRVGGSVKTQLS